jgi:hypothetical protein
MTTTRIPMFAGPASDAAVNPGGDAGEWAGYRDTSSTHAA